MSPDGAAPQLLQWDTTIPAERLSFLDSQMQVGPVAQAADKSLTCAVKSSPPEVRTLTCILAGGVKTVPNGPIAALRLRVLPNAPPGPAQVQTARGIAVLQGLKEVPLPPAQATVSVSSGSKK